MYTSLYLLTRWLGVARPGERKARPAPPRNSSKKWTKQIIARNGIIRAYAEFKSKPPENSPITCKEPQNSNICKPRDCAELPPRKGGRDYAARQAGYREPFPKMHGDRLLVSLFYIYNNNSISTLFLRWCASSTTR